MARMSLLAALTALYFSCCTATAQDPQPPLPVFQLLKQLDNDDATEMSSAYKQLKEMGPGIVQFMREPYLKPNSRGMRVSTHLAWDIQQKHKMPSTTINGMEFDVIADRVWRIPPPGGSVPVKLAIRITNRANSKVYFDTFAAFYLECIATENKTVKGGCAGDLHHVRDDYRSHALFKGNSIVESPYELGLNRNLDGDMLWLTMRDNTDGFGSLRYLKSGRYLFRFVYTQQPRGDAPLEDGTPRWRGETQGLTPFVIELK